MGLIRLLSEHVVNKIAAGEVIERPASVVKELVENSLDAGAERITVEVEEGGRTMIRISDDGDGMDIDDIRLAFAPHATSKLREVEDLFEISTLGFRGEALPSIGAVADVTIRTRPRGAPGGYALRNRGGQLGEVRPDGMPEGTRIEVRNLFYNTPVRLKFMKSTRTEMGHVLDCLTRFALAFPEVGFSLQHGGRTVLRGDPGESRRQRIGRLLGEDLGAALLSVEGEMDGMRLEGFAAPPSFARPTTSGQLVFLNGRFIRDRSVSHAIREAYRDLIPYGRQAVVVLFLTVDPQLVDVNVHPSKTEVRFRRGREVHDIVQREIRAVLLAADLAPPVAVNPPGSPFGRPDRGAGVAEAMTDFLRGRDPRDRECDLPWTGEQRMEAGGGAASDLVDGPGPGAPDLPRFVQMHDAYVVVETADGIAVIDQHALHERIIFDRLKRRLADGPLPSQGLLSPVVVEVPDADAALLEEHAELLARFGLVVDAFGPGAVAVRGVPQATRTLDPGRLLQDVLEMLRGDETGSGLDGISDELCDMLACKAAVKAGDPLPPAQIRALLEEAKTLEHGHTCPHGRPTTLVIGRGDLDRHFQRR
jgi:DNA mismatch repair protein MutL